jgi:succinoglycan biosynthesis transport protein ExoP
MDLKTRLAAGREELSESDSPNTIVHWGLGFVRRQWLIIVACFALVSCAGALYLVLTRPTFSASATMLMDPRKGGVQQKSVLGDAPADTEWIDSQLGILMLERDKIGRAVAEKLAKDPELLQLVDDEADRGLVARIVNLLGGRNQEFQSAKSEAQLAQQAAGSIAGRIDVKRIGLSYLVSINFSSYRPEQAAKFANAAADAFVVTELSQKYETLRQASDWLQERYQALREQASAADRAVVEFKATHNIVTAGGKFINDQQLTDVNNRIGEARAKVADQQAKLNQIQAVLTEQEISGTVDSTVSDALGNSIVTRLRGQYLDLVNREADWSKRLGKGHLAVVSLRSQMQDIRNSTHEELRRIAESYKSDLEIAKKNEQELNKQLQDIVSEIPNEAQIRLRALETSAQSYHAFYDNFLTSYTESVQQQTSPIPDTRVIAYASWAYQSNPQPLRVMIFAMLGGVALGFGGGMLREILDRSFRTTRQVQAALQIDCIALIPRIKIDREVGSLSKQKLIGDSSDRRIAEKGTGALQLMAKAPFSRFAEGIRALKLAADLRKSKDSAKIIGITSSLPREGKSTIGTALAAFASEVGGRVLLVDCDLRNPALSRSLAPHAQGGLIEVSAGQFSIDQVLLKGSRTDLAFLPAGNVSRLPDTSQILASDRTKHLFDSLRLEYDYIFVDLSPLSPVVDVRATTRLIDMYIVVVEWGSTNVAVVQQALRDAREVTDSALGIVLNKVDMNIFTRYEADQAQYYHNEYFSKYGYSD